MRIRVRDVAGLAAALAGWPLSAGAQPASAAHPELQAIAADVSADELKATITHLVGFGTRQTMSDTVSPTRGIGAARRWTHAQFKAISDACGGCLLIIEPTETVTGKRIPKPVEIVDVVAIQRGTSDPDRVVAITGHIDSRVTDVMNATSDAPGADDDGSGTAAVIEAARVLSKHKFPATIVYGVLSGEEQGLYGGKTLADYARAHGWKLEADLNNDIVGNIHGQGGEVVADKVRVFSEGTKSTETADQGKVRRYNGGEVDSPSRNLARFMDGLARTYEPGFGVAMVYRTDRYGRGGDQVEFLKAGYPAVRLTEGAEDYDRQHQDMRTVDGKAYGDVLSGVDFPYLAKVTRLNAVTLAALANAPAPPTDVIIKGAVSPDTTLSWTDSPGAARYRVWWRDTTAPTWTDSRNAGDADALTLKGVNIDDFFFGVSAASAAGYASPVEFPGAAGAFAVTGAPAE